tara:strand:- start:313 stop:624 length:312 start_codon:yes stop_codon:yes gene_type:complete
MLVATKYEQDDIVTFKIVNGDELVAKIVEDSDDAFTVTKPCTVMPSQQGIGLIQSLFTSDLNTSIRLEKKHVMMHSTTIKEIQNHYIKTTTGIEPVSAGSIVT